MAALLRSECSGPTSTKSCLEQIKLLGGPEWRADKKAMSGGMYTSDSGLTVCEPDRTDDHQIIFIRARVDRLITKVTNEKKMRK